MAVGFPTTALRWKKSNLHQHKTESEKIRGCFSIGRSILGKCFALKTCIVIVKSKQRVS